MPNADGTLTVEEKAAADKAKADAEAAEAKKKADDAAAAAAARGDKGQMVFPNAAALMARVKREAKKMVAEMLAPFGISNFDELKARLEKPAGSTATPAGGSGNGGGGNGHAKDKSAKEAADLRAENERLKVKLKEEESRRNRIHMNAQIDNAAVRAGMRSPEYITAARTIFLQTPNKDLPKIQGTESVDLDAFFAKLREQRPALFEQAAKPANSGVTGTPPAAAAAGGVASGKKASEMTDDEYRAARRSMGLST